MSISSSGSSSTKVIAKALKSKLTERFGVRFNEDDAVAAIKLVFDTISDELADGKRVSIKGFGSFYIHPRTGYERPSGILRRTTVVPDWIIIKFTSHTFLDTRIQKLKKQFFGGS